MKSNRSSSTSSRRKKPSSTTPPKPQAASPITKIEQQPQKQQKSNRTINEILILDNGGYTIKHITIPTKTKTSSTQTNNNSSDGQKCNYKETPNCTATLPHQVTMLVGDEIQTKLKNKSQCILQYPLERGYCTDLGTQLRIWNRIVSTSTSNNSTTKGSNNSCAVLLLTQPFTPSVISTNVDHVLFQDLKCGKLGKRLGASIAASHYIQTQASKTKSKNKCCLVIDSGFSMTHVIPTYNGYAISKGMKRINIGGKVLTNTLKQWLSYRQWNMMDEYSIVNEIKEKCCFVSQDYRNNLLPGKNALRSLNRQFVLPDFVSTFEGYVKGEEEVDPSNNTNNDNKRLKIEHNRNQPHENNSNNQVLNISTERCSIPELLFHPSDIGIQQIGLSQTILQSISSVDIQYQPNLWSNILFIGGNAKFPGMKQRLEEELRSLAPDFIMDIHVIIPDDPIGYTIQAAEEMVKRDVEMFLREDCLDGMVWEENNACSEDCTVWESLYYNQNDLRDEDMVLI